MHSGLLAFPNDKFYDGMIRPGVMDAKRRLILRNRPMQITKCITNENFPSIFWNV